MRLEVRLLMLRVVAASKKPGVEPTTEREVSSKHYARRGSHEDEEIAFARVPERERQFSEPILGSKDAAHSVEAAPSRRKLDTRRSLRGGGESKMGVVSEGGLRRSSDVGAHRVAR